MTPTPTEERYAMAERLSAPVYSIPRLSRIQGALDPKRLAAAVEQLIRRHAALRSGFAVDAAGIFHKYVVAEPPARLQLVDLPGAGLDEINAYLRPLLMAKPDLSPASLGHYHLLRVAPDLHYLSLAWHHSVSDGTSARLALTEIFAAYEGRELAAPGPPPGQVIPDDWAETEAYRSQLRWWEAQLDGAPEQLDLPGDLDWAEAPEMLALDHALSPAVSAAMAACAARLGVSEFTIAYAVTLALLSRLTGTADVLSAFQSNGRRAFPDAARSIGGYSNALVLRAPIEPQQSFAAYVAGLGARIRASVANEFPPYHHIIARTGVHPRFGVNWFPAPPAIEVPGLRIEDSSHDLRQSDYQLNFRFIRAGAARRLVLYYRARELSRQRIELLATQFEALVLAFAADPERPMAESRLANLLPLPERPAPQPAPENAELIIASFLRQAAAAPERPALQSAEGLLSYRQLALRAGGAAVVLRQAGVAPGGRVAILARRNAAFVANLLGVSLGGGSFVVLDEQYPDERLLQMLGEVAAVALLSSAGDDLADRARALAVAAGVALVLADPLREEEAVAPPAPSPDAPAYFLFTSGTTGEPSGIAVSHRPLNAFTRFQAAHFGIGADDRVTMFSGLGHDPLLRDIFTCLGAGATLLVPTQEDLLAPGALPRWVARFRPTVSHLTPPLGALLLAGAEAGALASLKLLFWGGDMLRPALVGQVRQAAAAAHQVNFYGSTETPQAATFFSLGDGAAPIGPLRAVPIGWATPGHEVRVVGEDGRPLGAYEPGEVEVRAPLLSLGRLRRGMILPFATPGCYRTGDRGFHRDDGAIQLVGRVDDQVKIRGFRVEPSAVAAVLEAHPRVSQAVSLADGDGDRRHLVAFTVDSLADDERAATLAAHVAGHLPPYMVPEQYLPVERLPLLPNGKTDRGALRAMLAEVKAGRRQQAEVASADEQLLIDEWQQVLGRDDIGPGDSLVSLGGDSLNFVNLYLATETVLGAVPEGWQLLSIRALCRSERKMGTFWRPVDTAILTRAVAISIVVAEHLRMIPYAFSGATAALFLVTGYFFAGLQLTTAFHNKSVRPLLRMMGNLLVPVLLFSLLLYGWKTVSGKHPHISVLTLTGNFHDFRGGNGGGREYYLWYIYAMVQILGIILLASWLSMRWRAREVDPWRFCWLLFGSGVLLRFGLPALWLPGFFGNGVEAADIWAYLPTTHLPTVALGGLILFAGADQHRRLLLAPVVLLYAAAQLWFFPGSGGWGYTLLFGLLLLFVRRVPVPRLLSVLLLPVSGASLFLYLTHFQFAGVLKHLGIVVPSVQVLWAMVCGVLLWRFYSWLSAQVGRWLRRRGDNSPAALADSI